MGKKGTEAAASERYPLRSAHNSSRVLRSASTKNNKASSESLNDSGASAAQPAVKKRKTGSSSGSPNNSARVLRSASKNKEESCSEPIKDSTAREPAANKRKGVSPSKVGSPNNSVRVLRSTSKNKDEPCSKPLNDSTAGEPAANRRKGASPSKVGSPNNSVRVLRSTSKNKNEECSEPRNDSFVAQPALKKRKSGSPSKVGSLLGSARVLRSTSKAKNVASNDPVNNSTAAQPAVRKSKSGTPSKLGSPKIGVRVLRSASKKKDEACSEPLNDSTSAQPALRKRKSGRASKECSPKKDYLKIRQRVRYVLNRMNYEQSLIQAYNSEGWRGQSSEKIRPVKELERAKGEILRCKLRIREAFQNMDSLLSEGKLEESLFDSAGEIYSEDIFCAICGSKDVTLQNDIILCDGACDRGFHQHCLNPPLLTEDIPPGDEGWLCPACLCKIDCIDALNELQGSKLSIHDSWEKVFPEVALLANGKQIEDSDHPPDDSEDNDDNPALAEGRMVNGYRSSAEDEGKVDDLGLPSEDSEDDDFDPAGPDSSEDQKNESHSEESDFTSDSDDFCAEIAKACGQDEVSLSPLNATNHTDRMTINAVDSYSNGEHSNRAFMETELEQDTVLPISSRRQVERLDYKKLYDEAYGEESSCSSDDEEWSGKEKLEDSETDESVRPAKRHSRRASAGHPSNQHTPQSEQLRGSVSEQQTEVLRRNCSNTAARKYHFDPVIKQKLKVHFEKNPYPNRATKESLAQELGLRFIQVDKWFASTRHNSRVAAAKNGTRQGNHTTGNNDSKAVDSTQATEPNDGVMENFTANENGTAYEGNKEDIRLSGAEIEMEAYGKESYDASDDKEWSETSTPQIRREDIETDSLAESPNHAKRRSRRASVGQLNNEHTPQSERLNGSVNEQQSEALRSNGSSSTARKYRFGPVANQKLKVHFEKDPYPSRTTIESLAQELGLTLIQVRRWFSSTRHCSSVAAAKRGKHPGNHTTQQNDSTTVDSIQVREHNKGVMEKQTADRNDVVPENFSMLRINLNEANNEDIYSQYTSCEERVVTPTAISREVVLPGCRPAENQGIGALWNSSFKQGLVMTPTTGSSEGGPPGYGPGENQGCGASWNMTPTVFSREVGPPGYMPGENRGNGASWNTSGEQRLVMTPTTISREGGPPGYGLGENQGTGAQWNTSEQRAVMAPTTISREAGPPGYGPGENQGNGASWNTSFKQRVVMTPTTISGEGGPPGYWPGDQGKDASWNTSSVHSVLMTPTTISSEVGPPGFGSGENQGKGASWNNSGEHTAPITPTTISSEVGPPGYWRPGENQGDGASRNVGSPKVRSTDKVGLVDEARKKAILRELRRMKKFR